MPGPGPELEEIGGEVGVATNDAMEIPNLNHPPPGEPPEAMAAPAGLAAESAVEETYAALSDWMAPAIKIPFVGGWLSGILKSFKTKARKHARHQYAKGDHKAAKGTHGLRGLLKALMLVPLYASQAIQVALYDLWKNALPARIHHAVGSIHQDIADLRHRATVIRTDLATQTYRVTKIINYVHTTVPVPVKTYVKTYVKTHRGVTTKQLTTLERSLKTYTRTQTRTQLVKHDTGIVNYLEDHKIAGLAGVVALAPALVKILTQAGLATEECRTANPCAVGVNPGKWLNFLKLFLAFGLVFDLHQLAEWTNTVLETVGPLLIVPLQKATNAWLKANPGATAHQLAAVPPPAA